MGFRYRKSKKILPGVRLNFSKKGVGVRFGGKHGGISVGPSGTHVSASIPGTGIYYTEKIKSKPSSTSKSTVSRSAAPASLNAKPKRTVAMKPWYIILAILIFFSGLAAFRVTFSGAFITILISIGMLIKTGHDFNRKVTYDEAVKANQNEKQ